MTFFYSFLPQVKDPLSEISNPKQVFSEWVLFSQHFLSLTYKMSKLVGFYSEMEEAASAHQQYNTLVYLMKRKRRWRDVVSSSDFCLRFANVVKL